MPGRFRRAAKRFGLPGSRKPLGGHGVIMWIQGVHMRKYGKFAALIAVILGVLGYLAVSGGTASATYYKSIAELNQMRGQANGKNLRVGGDIESGSIQHVGAQVTFVMVQDNLKLKVAYAGHDPLPDTFKDGAQALADGRLDSSGVFQAAKIQAKCASKYEVKPGENPGQMPPSVNTGKASI